MDFDNVTYENQGEWSCLARNSIKGKERRLRGEPVRVDVNGRPQVLNFRSASVQPFDSDSDARLEVVICADPPIRGAEWSWGKKGVNRLREGESSNRFSVPAPFRAQSSPSSFNADCRTSTLNIANVKPSDAALYTFTAANDRGTIR